MIASFVDSETGLRYSFFENQLSELGPFEPEAAFETFNSIDLLEEVTGTWKMRMKDGILRNACGTVRDYDQIVSILVRRRAKLCLQK